VRRPARRWLGRGLAARGSIAAVDEEFLIETLDRFSSPDCSSATVSSPSRARRSAIRARARTRAPPRKLSSSASRMRARRSV